MSNSKEMGAQAKAAAKGLNKLFKTTEGEALIALLERRYCSLISDDNMARDVGRMDVVHFLKRLGADNE